MKIALLSDGIPPFVMGGMQKHSFLIAEYMARANVNVLLFHCVPPSQVPTNGEVAQLFSDQARLNIEVSTFTYEDHGVMPGHYLRAQKELSVRYFESLRDIPGLDFIYTKGFAGQTVLARRNELVSNCPIGVKFHGMNMYQNQPDLKSELTKYMLRPRVSAIVNQSDCVFSYGGKITSILERVVRNVDRIVEIPAGIDQSWVRSSFEFEKKEKTRFLFVGRYDRVKGLPEFYQSLHMISNQRDWDVSMVGPIPERNQIKNHRLRYVGAIHDSKELKAVFDQHDVLICPSISEGMPNVILEAMSRGLAIVATNVGATSVLIDQNGVLVDKSNPKLIADAMNQILSLSMEDLHRMKMKSIEKIKKGFTWDSIAIQLLYAIKNSRRI